MMHLELMRKESNYLFVNNDTLAIGVAGKNCNTINYRESFGKIRKYERFLLHFEAGASPDNIYFLNQEHGDTIKEVVSAADINEPFYATADAMVTNKKGYCLAIRTADCIPVLLADMTHNCIAAIHSGWKSTEKNISGKTIALLSDLYGADPASIQAYILPGISQESYEVSKDVAEKFPECYIYEAGKYTLDLKKAVVLQLQDAGLIKNNIFASYFDTFSNNDLFFSHRKGDTGRNINSIMIK